MDRILRILEVVDVTGCRGRLSGGASRAGTFPLRSGSGAWQPGRSVGLKARSRGG